ncbi:uncharacterized protein LOC122641211 isoform X1 [Telopea speciosissima]|uniref:uncharacterized protein LOC122641211 isoform X1 n=1 Tax=Telopea speciosissima TaxID=54955 RepID=UPI001CC49465|nr:uncharacterized protein LOC122641211 isoform X1 [Telopea speciosissima]
MTSQYPADIDSGAADSVTLSPRSDNPPPPPPPPSSQRQHEELHPRVRFMCSFGGRILPRPHDNQLRYVGGDTRIVAVSRSSKFSALLVKLSKFSGNTDFTIKYQLPNEDLDALITVSTDEDVENMMEEYDRLTHGSNSKTARLRLFLFPINVSSSSSLSSIIDGQSKRVREQWFFDAINGAVGVVSTTPSLERGRSEVSSILSEVPDYLFGFDNSDESRDPKSKANVSVSDPSSPARVPSPPYSSTSSVKTKIEDPIPVEESKESQIDGFKETGEQTISRQIGYTDNTTWQHFPASHFPGPAIQPVPVYYVLGPVPLGKVPAAVVPVSATYIQRFPVGFHHTVQGVGQVYGVKAVTAVEAYNYPPAPTGVIPEVLNQQAYYTERNPRVIPSYPAAAVVVPSVPDLQATTSETMTGRVSQPQ